MVPPVPARKVPQQRMVKERQMARVEPGAGETRVAQRPAAMALAWAVVAIPAAWGVYNTVLRASHLFAR